MGGGADGLGGANLLAEEQRPLDALIQRDSERLAVIRHEQERLRPAVARRYRRHRIALLRERSGRRSMIAWHVRDGRFQPGIRELGGSPHDARRRQERDHAPGHPHHRLLPRRSPAKNRSRIASARSTSSPSVFRIHSPVCPLRRPKNEIAASRASSSGRKAPSRLPLQDRLRGPAEDFYPPAIHAIEEVAVSADEKRPGLQREDAEECHVFLEKPQEKIDQAPQALLRRGGRVERLLGHAAHKARLGVDNGAVEFQLVWVQLVDLPDAATGLGGHIAHGRAAKAPLREDPLGQALDRLSLLLGVGGAGCGGRLPVSASLPPLTGVLDPAGRGRSGRASGRAGFLRDTGRDPPPALCPPRAPVPEERVTTTASLLILLTP